MENKYEKLINKLKKEIEEKHLTCIVYQDGEYFTHDERGIKPIVDFWEKGYLKDGIIVDKIIGKASAIFMIDGGAKHVHGMIISKLATEILEKNNISFSGDKFVEKIANRSGDGLCPMETAVAQTDIIKEGIGIINNKIAEMKRKMT